MNNITEKFVRYALFSLFFIAVCLQSSLSRAETTPLTHSHQNIKGSAHQYIMDRIDTAKYSKININMGHLDSRLTLAQCDSPLESNLAPGAQLSGKTTIHIRCNSPKPWTVYLSAHISLYKKVIKTLLPLDKGHILKQSDLVVSEEDISRIRRGYFTDSKNLVGKELKRRLPQNKLIKANYVKSPTLVKRGERVSIVAETSGYSVKMSGTALANGARGDRIRVKNLSSKRVVEGTVKQAGIISIN